jgi:3'-5' exoribonuclease
MDPHSLEVGEVITAAFLVAEAKGGVDKRGQDYYSLTLNCAGGRQVDAKVWADNIGAPLEAGQGIEALARIDQYMGRIQLNIQRYRILSADQFDVGQYVRCTEINTDEAFEILFDWNRDEFRNPCFKRLMLEFHGNGAFARDFKTSPAASFHHHNYMGGLIEHTLEVWNAAGKLYEIYDGRLDRDLLMCGAALHDVGKIKTYTLVSGVSQHTDAGQLLNHIFITASMVSNLWDRLMTKEAAGQDAEKAARAKELLIHIILSHHGKREWGSPVLPQTSEALLIHLCDQVSATMRSSLDAVAALPASESWTDWVYILDERRKLFSPPA